MTFAAVVVGLTRCGLEHFVAADSRRPQVSAAGLPPTDVSAIIYGEGQSDRNLEGDDVGKEQNPRQIPRKSVGLNLGLSETECALPKWVVMQ